MTMDKYKYIIFDFDMTLVDTELGSIYSYEKAITKAGGKFNKEQISVYMSEFLNKTYERIRNPLISEQEFEEEFYFYSHKKMATMSRLFPEVKKVLSELSKTHILAIVTNKDILCINQIIKHHKIDTSMFRCIISCDDVTKRKPDPQGLELCMSKIGATPDECVYVGDSINDLIFAENACVKGIRVVRDRDSLPNDNIICDLSALMVEGDCIEKLGNQ